MIKTELDCQLACFENENVWVGRDVKKEEEEEVRTGLRPIKPSREILGARERVNQARNAILNFSCVLTQIVPCTWYS